ncbi:hypothetical protein NIES22_45220 [Calothrix brevissima NIES-22]|nr:hypothetical protein NIES22_45220 [Calothrix brevissima NIES-22]
MKLFTFSDRYFYSDAEVSTTAVAELTHLCSNKETVTPSSYLNFGKFTHVLVKS